MQQQPTKQDQIVGEQASDSFVGKVVANKYEVVDLIGRGGMGSVYKVMHRQLKKEMAMKVLPHGDGLDRVDVARFDAEAKAASILNHPNLAGIHDYGVCDDGSPYIVMDYIAGEPLSQLIERSGALPQQEAIDLFLQICGGLEFAHSKNLIHRDIKPSNIIVSKDAGKTLARIVDFGIAKKLPTPEEHSPALTQTGEIIGSPQYMSPEQGVGGQLDTRSDIYSLGCVMFETLTGKPPFTADNAMMLIMKHVNERAPLFKTVSPEIKTNHALERIVLQALEKDPDSRYQNISDLKRDLELVKEGKNPVKEVARMRSNLRSIKKVGKVCAAVTLIAALCCAAMYFALASLRTPWGERWAQANSDLVHFNYEEAETHYKQAIKIAEAKNAPAGERERILFELGTFYNERNRHTKAIQCLQEALKISDTHGVDAFRGTLYDTLAIVYQDMKDFKNAEKAARTAVEIKEAQLGTYNVYTGHSVNRLANALRWLRRYDEAEKEARKSVEIADKVYPASDNPEVAVTYRLLTDILADESSVRNDQAKVAETIAMANKTLDLRIKIQGVDHPQTAKFAKWYVGYLKSWHHDAEAAAVAKRTGVPLNAPEGDD